ncbi:hypothetical protein FRC09_005670 [Ceratobasidium sp. 395]|nr:hypothetical protein FRC09_005670 [Ceratobasidium sp. 395]
MALHLLFNDGITKCQVPGGMAYSEESLEHAHNVTVCLAKARAPEVAPDQWLGLPVADANHSRVAIDGNEKEAIVSTATRLPSDAQERVETFMEAINNHETHIPASVSRGSCPRNSPGFLPASPPDTLVEHMFKTLWLSVDFFKDWFDASPECTIRYAVRWVLMFLDHNFIRHQPSGTLSGGEHGVVWLFRILVKLLLNIATIRGSLGSSDPLPAGYDSKRTAVDKYWHKILEAIDRWIDTIKASADILADTSGD